MTGALAKRVSLTGLDFSGGNAGLPPVGFGLADVPAGAVVVIAGSAAFTSGELAGVAVADDWGNGVCEKTVVRQKIIVATVSKLAFMNLSQSINKEAYCAFS